MPNENDVIELTCEGRLHQQRTINVYHFQSSQNATTLQQLLTAFVECIRTTLLPALSNEWSLVQVRARVIWPTPGDEEILTALTTDVGGIATEALPSTVAAVLSIRTGQSNKTKRGRKYIAGVPESGAGSSRLTTGEMALLVAFAACLIAKFVEATSMIPFQLVVLSRKNAAAAGNSIGTATTNATQISVASVLGTMRSRKIGVGS